MSEQSGNAVGPIGLIGVGAMGGAMARCLLRKSHRVVVRDIVPEREQALAALGAVVAASPAEVVRAANVVFTIVIDAAQTDAVLFGHDGLAEAAPPGTVVVMCSTVAPGYAASLPARL